MKQRFRERLMEVNAYQFHNQGTPLPMVKFDDANQAYVMTAPDGIRLYLEPSDWIIEEDVGFSVMADGPFTAKFQEI